MLAQELPLECDTPNRVTGDVKLVRFSSQESGWAVLVVATADGSKHTVVGTGHGIRAGEHVACEGEWAKHPKFGRQFKATSILHSPPCGSTALESFLASGAVEGIGAAYAKRLVETFGEYLPSMLDSGSRDLESVPGIGPRRRERITDSWRQQSETRDVMMFLRSHGIGPARASQIHARYGKNAAAMITVNPYRLSTEFHGIGFKLADAAALSFGISLDDPKRIFAGVTETLSSQRLCGDCTVPEHKLLSRTAELLEINEDAVHTQLVVDIAEGRFAAERHGDDKLVFLPSLLAAERQVAERLIALSGETAPWPAFSIAEEMAAAETTLGITLSDSQRRAVTLAARSKVCVITGGPGSGKTTLTRVLVHMLANRVEDIVLCAPTGRAARRLSDATGREARTIHRLLKGGPGAWRFGHNEDVPLMLDALTVDEMSMVDVELTNALVNSPRPEGRGFSLPR